MLRCNIHMLYLVDNTAYVACILSSCDNQFLVLLANQSLNFLLG